MWDPINILRTAILKKKKRKTAINVHQEAIQPSHPLQVYKGYRFFLFSSFFADIACGLWTLREPGRHTKEDVDIYRGHSLARNSVFAKFRKKTMIITTVISLMSCEKKLRYANTQSYSSVIPRMRVQIFVFVIFIKALFRNWDSRLQHLCRRIEANIFYCQVLCLHNSSFLLPFGYNIMPYNLELYISLLHLFPQKYVLFITYQQELYFESWLSVGRMESG